MESLSVVGGWLLKAVSKHVAGVVRLPRATKFLRIPLRRVPVLKFSKKRRGSPPDTPGAPGTRGPHSWRQAPEGWKPRGERAGYAGSLADLASRQHRGYRVRGCGSDAGYRRLGGRIPVRLHRVNGDRARATLTQAVAQNQQKNPRQFFGGRAAKQAGKSSIPLAKF